MHGLNRSMVSFIVMIALVLGSSHRGFSEVGGGGSVVLTLWDSHPVLIVITGFFLLALVYLTTMLSTANKKNETLSEQLATSQAELLRDREYLNSLSRHANAPIITWSPGYRITEFNRAFEKLTGRTRDEVLGKHLEILFPDESRLESMKHIDRTVAGEFWEVIDIPIKHKSGRVHSVLWNSANIKSPEGKLIATIAQGQDITERKKSEEDLVKAYDATIKGWGYAVELKDRSTENHSQRVTGLVLTIAEELGVKAEDLVHIRRGAFLHDIGKMGIPDDVLLKPGELNAAEWDIMYKHPEYAHEMLSYIDYLRPALDIPYCHHEKWDGSGYPRGLKGTRIPLAARIFAVVDVYDALTSDRPYRRAWTKEKALEYIKEQAGKHFDPNVVDVFVNHLEREGFKAD
jgi:PAS domain S-box-containing protein/putative nucleotidyltransferase with HDIG domain